MRWFSLSVASVASAHVPESSLATADCGIHEPPTSDSVKTAIVTDLRLAMRLLTFVTSFTAVASRRFAARDRSPTHGGPRRLLLLHPFANDMRTGGALGPGRSAVWEVCCYFDRVPNKVTTSAKGPVIVIWYVALESLRDFVARL